MRVQFLKINEVYTGEQLKPLWIYENTSLLGDALVAWVGEASVGLDHMIDMEDVKNKDWIYSTQMVHFIVECFHQNVITMTAFQRVMVFCLYESLVPFLKPDRLKEDLWVRKGDDWYFNKKKLNVGIATQSPTSGMIHIGVNVSSKETPVPTIGLEDFSVPVEKWVNTYLELVKLEWDSIVESTFKVKSL